MLPAFVQQTSAYSDTTQQLVLRARSGLIAGDRLVVEASTWGRGARTTSVSDSAGDHYTELVRHQAADGTELSVWTAPVRNDGGTAPTITVTPDSTADVGAVAVEYSGLSTAPGARAVDRIAVATGRTRRAAVIGSGATQATTKGHELAVGLYADSGFGDIVTPSHLFTERANISRTSTMMEQLVEDRVVSGGARPDATVRTGARTPWLMATVVFRPAGVSGRPVTALARAPRLRAAATHSHRGASTAARVKRSSAKTSRRSRSSGKASSTGAKRAIASAATSASTTASSGTTTAAPAATASAPAAASSASSPASASAPASATSATSAVSSSATQTATTAAQTTTFGTQTTTAPTLTSASPTLAPSAAAQATTVAATQTTSATVSTATRVLTSYDLVQPLSSRRRPHAVAGAISEYLGLTDGFLPLYYCLARAAGL
jgi:hypothetical protein